MPLGLKQPCSGCSQVEGVGRGLWKGVTSIFPISAGQLLVKSRRPRGDGSSKPLWLYWLAMHGLSAHCCEQNGLCCSAPEASLEGLVSPRPICMSLHAQHGHSALRGTEEPNLSESAYTGMRGLYRKTWPFLHADPALTQSGKLALVHPSEKLVYPEPQTGFINQCTAAQMGPINLLG